VDGFVRTLDAIRLECWTGSDQNAGRHHLRTPGRLPLESAGFAPKIGEPPANDGLVIVFLRHVNFSLLRFCWLLMARMRPPDPTGNVARFSERGIPDIAFAQMWARTAGA
jgi:hypothetical protein